MELLWRRRNNEVWLTTDECYQPKMFSVAAENMGGVARPWLHRAELAALRQADDFLAIRVSQILTQLNTDAAQPQPID
jgi:hypothetical protein